MTTEPTAHAPRRGPARRALFGLAAAAVAGCAPLPRQTAVPRGSTTRATVLGLPNERFIPTERGLAALGAEFATAAERGAAAASRRGGERPGRPPALLAVSGGGEDGAFGAGLLVGWTAHGTRPDFAMVTGISTGALTAPFAYLGPDWDHALRAVYTEITLADVAIQRPLIAVLNDDGMADTTPLYNTIRRYLDARMLEQIAARYRAGPLLLIGTTDLDAQLPVIWNIGAIAASGHPRALDLVHRILLASAAIPGAFPPVMIDVEVDGRPYQEMHVDGGAIAQAFLYPGALGAPRREAIRRGERPGRVDAYVIRNARFEAGWEEVERRAMTIAGRAVTTMIAASGFNDVQLMALNAERDGIDFHLAYIDRGFTTPWPGPFDQDYMRALFEHGFGLARQGYRWSREPPLVRLLGG